MKKSEKQTKRFGNNNRELNTRATRINPYVFVMRTHFICWLTSKSAGGITNINVARPVKQICAAQALAAAQE